MTLFCTSNTISLPQKCTKITWNCMLLTLPTKKWKNLKSLLLTWNDHHQKRSSSLHFLKINGLSVQLSLMMRSVTQSRLIYFKLSRLKLRMIQGKHIGFIVKEKVLMHLKKSMFWQWGPLSILQKTSSEEILFLLSWIVRSLREWPLSSISESLGSCSRNIFF